MSPKTEFATKLPPATEFKAAESRGNDEVQRRLHPRIRIQTPSANLTAGQLLAVGERRFPKSFAESDAKARAVGKPASRGDLADRHIRAGKQLAAFVEADAADFLGWTATEVTAELDLETSAGDRYFMQNILDDNVLKRSLLDEAKRANDRVVVNGENVRRLATNHPVRRNLDGLRRGTFAVHHAIKGGGGLVTNAATGQRNAAKGRRADLAHQVVGVAGENRDLVGNANAGHVADFSQLPAALSIDGENGDWPRQRGEPAAHPALLFFPPNFAADAVTRFVFVTLQAGFANDLDEFLAALRGIAMIRRGEIGEFLEASVAEVVKSELGAFGVVGNDVANARQALKERIDVDDGHFAFANLIDLQTIAEADDHAVAVPKIRKRRTLIVILRIKQQVPVTVILGVVGDAADNAAAPAIIGFDENGDLASLRARIHGRAILQMRKVGSPNGAMAARAG